MSRIEELLSKKILILDGPMGTIRQANKFTEQDLFGSRFTYCRVSHKGNNDLFSVIQVSAFADIHLGKFKASADIVRTNTLPVTRTSMSNGPTYTTTSMPHNVKDPGFKDFSFSESPAA